MMPLAMASFPLQLESIMFSLMVFGVILLEAGLADGEAAVGALSSHDLAKRAVLDDTALVLDSVRAGLRKRHPRVKRTPMRRHRSRSSDDDTSSDYVPIAAAAARPTTRWPYAYTTAYVPTPPYTGGPNIYPKTTQRPFFWATTRNNFQATQGLGGWVPTARWTGPSTNAPWVPVHTNPWRPAAPSTKSTEQPEVIEFTPSPDPQSGLDAVTTRYIIIGSVSGGVLIIVIVFIIVAVVLYRHKRRPPADDENEMKAIPHPVVSNTPISSVNGKKGTKSSRQSKDSKRSKSSSKNGLDNPTISSQPDSLYENP